MLCINLPGSERNPLPISDMTLLPVCSWHNSCGGFPKVGAPVWESLEQGSYDIRVDFGAPYLWKPSCEEQSNRNSDPKGAKYPNMEYL